MSLTLAIIGAMHSQWSRILVGSKWRYDVNAKNLVPHSRSTFKTKKECCLKQIPNGWVWMPCVNMYAWVNLGHLLLKHVFWNIRFETWVDWNKCMFHICSYLASNLQLAQIHLDVGVRDLWCQSVYLFFVDILVWALLVATIGSSWFYP